jgi:hypothetical protein
LNPSFFGSGVPLYVVKLFGSALLNGANPTPHLGALADGGVADGPGVPLCHRHQAQVTAADAERRARGA